MDSLTPCACALAFAGWIVPTRARLLEWRRNAGKELLQGRKKQRVVSTSGDGDVMAQGWGRDGSGDGNVMAHAQRRRAWT